MHKKVHFLKSHRAKHVFLNCFLTKLFAHRAISFQVLKGKGKRQMKRMKKHKKDDVKERRKEAAMEMKI